MLAVAYFAALLARSADRWTARDADLDEIEDVAGLVELMREAPEDDDEAEEPDTAVLLLEQEDVWFAVVRLDAEEDPRLFVSNVAAVSRSAYAELLLSGGLVPVGPDGSPLEEAAADIGDEGEGADGGVDGGVDGEDVDVDADVVEPLAQRTDLTGLDDANGARRTPRSGPAGDAALLADFGVRASRLVSLCGGEMPPADALANLAEALGAADELEEVR